MKLKDLSFWGIFKLVLIFEYLVWIVIGPILLLIYVLNPDAINISGDFSVNLFGIKFLVDSLPASFIFIPIMVILKTIIFAFIHFTIFQKTPFGNIPIGEPIETQPGIFD